MSTIDAREFYHAETKKSLAKANARIAKFAEDLVKNPAYALEWADAAFEDGARAQLLSTIDSHLENGETLEQVLELAQRQMFNGARYANSYSTSQCKSLLRNCAIMALADEVETIRAHLGLPRF